MTNSDQTHLKDKKLSPWDNPPPPTKSMKRVIAIMKSTKDLDVSWIVRPLSDFI